MISSSANEPGRRTDIPKGIYLPSGFTPEVNPDKGYPNVRVVCPPSGFSCCGRQGEPADWLPNEVAHSASQGQAGQGGAYGWLAVLDYRD
jgi:hypothetical protein